MRHSMPLFASLILLFNACSGRDTGDTVGRQMLDGVPLMRNTGSPQHEGPLFEMTSDLVLGIDEGEPEWQIFGGLAYALVAPDGRMVLADMGRCEVFIVTPEGELQSRVGGKGSGPGEFNRTIWGLLWAERGQEFWVMDRDLLRFSCYTIDGEFLQSSPYAQEQRVWDYFLGLGDRRFLAAKMGSMEEKSNTRYTFVDDQFQEIRDFIELPPQQMWKDKRRGGWGFIPYTVMDGIVVFPDGRIISYHPNEPRITVYSPEGDPLLHIVRDWDFPSVTEEEKEYHRRIFRDNPGNEPFRHWATDMPFPDKHAAFDFVMPDDEGRIWVRRTGSGHGDTGDREHIFDVFDREGIWLGIQELPHKPVAIQGGYLYVTYSAESGAPRFERISLRALYR